MPDVEDNVQIIFPSQDVPAGLPSQHRSSPFFPTNERDCDGHIDMLGSWPFENPSIVFVVFAVLVFAIASGLEPCEISIELLQYKYITIMAAEKTRTSKTNI